MRFRPRLNVPVSLGSVLIVLIAVAVIAGPLRDRPSADRTAGPQTASRKPPYLRLLVPAYFYPSNSGLKEWNRLIEAAKRVPVTAIVNVSNGPDDKIDLDYANIIRRASDAGVTVAGYVNTNYGSRAIEEVRADIERWRRWYPQISAIFLDGQAVKEDNLDHYRQIRKIVAEILPGAEILTNPGAVCDEAYFKEKVCERVCVFERPRGFEQFESERPKWWNQYRAECYSAIPYGVGSIDLMKRYLQKATQMRIGSIYVTDASGKNRWSRLPEYWEAEVQAIHRINQRQAP